MKKMIKKFENKLYEQHLVEKNEAFIGVMNVEPLWNKESNLTKKLSEIMLKLDIGAMIFANPKKPYSEIVYYLSDIAENETIIPNDSETRTFMHSFKILKKINYTEIEKLLKVYKLLIIPHKGILTVGALNLEQAFVNFSSVCFSCFIKFCTDSYFSARKGLISNTQKQIINELMVNNNNETGKNLLKEGFLRNEKDILNEIIKTGKLTVIKGLVDSYFGNLSYKKNKVIYITQTGSALDELKGLIDRCSFESFSKSITASSEFASHKRIYEETDFCSILHGHPKFSVIISLLCDDLKCKKRHNCYILCTKKRFFQNIPIVVGEIGQGPNGICHSVPPAVKEHKSAIVFGHGVFTVGKKDFKEAFQTLFEIENKCKDFYFNTIL